MIMTGTPLMAGSDQAWSAVLETMDEVRPVIRAVMAGAGMATEADDVAQETVLSAVTGIERWSPASGPLVAWVTTIGKRRAIDHIRKTKRGASMIGVAGQGYDENDMQVVDPAVAGHEEEITERADVWDQVRSVLTEVRAVLRNDRTMHRALTLLVECDGQVGMAARRLGVAEPVVREARRETVQLAVVVQRARKLHDEGAPVTLGALVSCLPEEVGAWTRVIALEAAHAGGFGKVAPEQIASATGWSYSTARQRLARTSRVLSIARTIAEQGALTS